DRSALPGHVARPLLAQAEAAAAQHRFLHWPLAFPEIFTGEPGRAGGDGFDAIVGNPPWDMVRGDSGDAARRQGRRHDARRLTAVDAGVGLDSRRGIVPRHRSVRFALVTCTAGSPTRAISCRFGLSRIEEIDTEDEARGAPIVLTRALLSRLSGDDDLGIPELAGAMDLRPVERVSATVPWLGSERGWHVRFGRQLNATDDREAFVPWQGGSGARPVIEGKQIEPFRTVLDRCRLQLASGADAARRVPRRPRLAYRDVAS